MVVRIKDGLETSKKANIFDRVNNLKSKEVERMDELDEEQFNPHFFTEKEIKTIRDDLLSSNVDLMNRAWSDPVARESLVLLIQKEQRFSKDLEGFKKAQYLTSKLVGLDFLDQFVKDESISDIGWNGSFLTVEGNNLVRRYTAEQLGLEDPEVVIFRIVSKFAASVGKKFASNGHEILDAVTGSFRLNAIHKDVSTSGTTMSLRVMKPNMSLTKDNFIDFAPEFVLDFLKVSMESKNSALIGGETGSGKTELMKLMFSFAKKYHKIFLIEDVPEMQLKNLLPEHDIYSYVTNPNVSISKLNAAGNRNFPVWIAPSETRDSSAYEMIESSRTGHSVISSLHVASARAIPRRLVTMSASGFAINEKAVTEDILENFRFGLHIKVAHIEIDPENMIFYKVRYLSEIVEYSVDKVVTVFSQVFRNGKFYVTTKKFSDNFAERLAENFTSYEFPEMNDELINKSEELTTVLSEVGLA